MTIYLGNDLGMGANKLYGPWGGNQTLSQIAISDGAHLEMGNIRGLKRRRRPVEVQTKSGTYYVGDGAHDFGRAIEYIDFERLTGTPEMTALFYGAMTNYMKTFQPINDPVHMVVGLPVAMMNGSDAKANAAAVKKWMLGLHLWMADGESHAVNIQTASLVPQALGALFDYCVNDDGSFSDQSGLLNQEVGVISIGFNTIELLVVRDRAPVENFISGRSVGVRRLLDLVNHENAYTLGELDTRLRSGNLDISQALPMWEREVTGEVTRQWGRAMHRFAKIIVVGGGALLLRDLVITRFDGKTIIPSDPVQSVARGLYKIALLRR